MDSLFGLLCTPNNKRLDQPPREAERKQQLDGLKKSERVKINENVDKPKVHLDEQKKLTVKEFKGEKSLKSRKLTNEEKKFSELKLNNSIRMYTAPNQTPELIEEEKEPSKELEIKAEIIKQKNSFDDSTDMLQLNDQNPNLSSSHSENVESPKNQLPYNHAKPNTPSFHDGYEGYNDTIQFNTPPISAYYVTDNDKEFPKILDKKSKSESSFEKILNAESHSEKLGGSNDDIIEKEMFQIAARAFEELNYPENVFTIYLEELLKPVSEQRHEKIVHDTTYDANLKDRANDVDYILDKGLKPFDTSIARRYLLELNSEFKPHSYCLRCGYTSGTYSKAKPCKH